MRHFASAALMTSVKPHASFEAFSPYSGARLPAAEYGIMVLCRRLPRSKPDDTAPDMSPKRRHAVLGTQGGRKTKNLSSPL